MTVVPLQGPLCIRKEVREYGDSNKAVPTGIPANLGKYQRPILYCLSLKEDDHLELRQSVIVYFCHELIK
jgi:hypothetical protein